MIEEYFNFKLLLTSCLYTTDKQVELTSGQLVKEREWELSQLSQLIC